MLREAINIGNITAVLSGGIFSLGLNWIEFSIGVISLLILFSISLLQRKGSVREKIAARALPVRWLLWYGLLFMLFYWDIMDRVTVQQNLYIRAFKGEEYG